MSAKGDESGDGAEAEPTPASTIKQKCFQCIKGPANILMTLVVVALFGASCVQVASCIGKIFKPPVTTYTHFEFNKTLQYPAVTFCRDPPYDFNELEVHVLYPNCVLELSISLYLEKSNNLKKVEGKEGRYYLAYFEQKKKHGLYAHPRWTSMWAGFDFDAVSLAELWNRTTYDIGDYFVQLGLAGEQSNLEISSIIGFMMGTCYTIKPKILSPTALKETGYSVLLKHSAEDIATSTSIYPPGYHVFIHTNEEPYTEVFVPGTGLVDYLYVNIGEEIDIKLTVNKYTKLSTEEDSCSTVPDYSASECTTAKLWRELDAAVGCSGPWIGSELPPCANYTAMRSLISSYVGSYSDFGNGVQCPRRCNAYFYQAFVTNRQVSSQWDHTAKKWIPRTGDDAYQTQLYMHFNSMMVSVYEERYNYDWTVFVADLGGSVGFLLGLSVIGTIKIVGKVWALLVRPAIRAPRRKSAPPPPPPPPELGEKPSQGWITSNQSYYL